MKDFNFIVVSLCDNDFSHHLETALQHIIEGGFNFCPIVMKTALVELVTTFSFVNHLRIDDVTKARADAHNTRAYLYGAMRVEFSKDLPRYEPNGKYVDHDGGSIYYNVNLNAFGRF